MSEHANRLFQTAISELQKRVKRIEERKADEQILAIARSRVAEPAPINTDVEALAQLLQGVPMLARSSDKDWVVLSVYEHNGVLIVDIDGGAYHGRM
ncbi:hypothetical protein LCGC14_2160340 [marine sediment metagenome]|uniref:Uncharacterized protein n=1 Tax=marine sediment metagenome TaxID=412755 RepID=A0A0F9GP39_9ZZZZ